MLLLFPWVVNDVYQAASPDSAHCQLECLKTALTLCKPHLVCYLSLIDVDEVRQVQKIERDVTDHTLAEKAHGIRFAVTNLLGSLPSTRLRSCMHLT